MDASQFQRRIGRVDFDVVALDLTSAALQKALGVSGSDLTSDDLTICETLADLALDAGFDALIGPSAALPGETTVAVFGNAIEMSATAIEDMGIRAI